MRSTERAQNIAILIPKNFFVLLRNLQCGLLYCLINFLLVFWSMLYSFTWLWRLNRCISQFFMINDNQIIKKNVKCMRYYSFTTAISLNILGQSENQCPNQTVFWSWKHTSTEIHLQVFILIIQSSYKKAVQLSHALWSAFN